MVVLCPGEALPGLSTLGLPSSTPGARCVPGWCRILAPSLSSGRGERSDQKATGPGRGRAWARPHREVPLLPTLDGGAGRRMSPSVLVYEMVTIGVLSRHLVTWGPL